MVPSIMVDDKLTHFFLAFSFLLLANAIHAKAVNDSLKQGDMLNSSNKLCSAGGRFCMGFEEFPVDSGFNYLGIYHANDNWISWIANRDEPIMNKSGVLTLDSSGTLKILRQDQDPIILYSLPQTTNINTMATLFDNGNFELQSNGSVLWQSFDYPNDILLPGMKLGVNHKAGHSWFLLSSATDKSLASGAFTLEWDTTNRELKISQRGQVYWRSGTLRNKKFQYISDHIQDMYKYTHISNEDEDSFTYTTQSNDYTLWSLDDSGELIDGKGNVIASADKCYGYNTDEGCQRWQVPSCRHDGQVFDVLTGYLNGSADVSIDTNTSFTLSDCKAACWSNCDCIAFYSYFDNKTGCTFYNGDSWEFINYASGHSIHMIVTKSSEYKSIKKWIWISAVIAMVLFISFVGIICLVRKRRKALVEKKKTMEIAKNLSVFSYASIITATNRFSSANKLGQGGFGSVYKGKLQAEKEVAIKRLSKSSRQGITEFKNELTLISEFQHENLVQLLGYCTHGHERILIYEYMPNKSLDFLLFDSTKSKLLDWKKRFNIIEGIVQGLLYLHRYSRLKVIHRDLKADNILLDENMNPKISDFGLARIFTQESGENTTRLAGTLSYMPPECATEQVYSIKSDVYSFGVLMLEIVSGKRNNHFGVLLKHAWELWKNGEGLKLMDQAITDSADQDQILRCIHVALLCLEELPVNRPNMSEILSMLTNESSTLRLPKQPAFNFRRSDGVEEIQSTEEPNINTINGLTISVISAR